MCAISPQLKKIVSLVLICAVVMVNSKPIPQFDDWNRKSSTAQKNLTDYVADDWNYRNWEDSSYYNSYKNILTTTTSTRAPAIDSFGSGWYDTYMDKYRDTGKAEFSGYGTKSLDKPFSEYKKYSDDELFQLLQAEGRIGYDYDWSEDQKSNDWKKLYDVPAASYLSTSSSSPGDGQIYFYEVLVAGFFVLAVFAISYVYIGRCLLYCRQQRGLLYIRDTAIIIAGRRPQSDSKENLLGNAEETPDDPPPGYNQCVPEVHSLGTPAAGQ